MNCHQCEVEIAGTPSAIIKCDCGAQITIPQDSVNVTRWKEETYCYMCHGEPHTGERWVEDPGGEWVKWNDAKALQNELGDVLGLLKEVKEDGMRPSCKARVEVYLERYGLEGI